MIVGDGDIATAIRESGLDNDYFLFFASGVSNSQETRESEYLREIELLKSMNDDRHIVYFSTLSIFYSNTDYALHKRYMEGFIQARFFKHTIVRLGNITWGTNPHTIINFFRNKIKNNEEFEIRDEYRYIIDKDEFIHWLSLLPAFCCEMNITGKRMKVKEIVEQYGHA